MKIKNKIIIVSILFLICGIYIAYKGCFGTPVITIFNDSHAILKNIKISGTGYSKIILEIKPKEKFTFVASAKGETGIIIDFESPNGRIFRDDLAYIEARGGYGVLLTITNNFEIKTDYEMNKFYLKRIL
ncbi:MAG: hypothetical protein WAW67_03415 [Candidatus Omnitrophota bacterium]